MHKQVVFKPYCQNQQVLLPKNIDDFVTQWHIARLISKIIDSMNVQHIIAPYKGGGTSSYNPRMLLKAKAAEQRETNRDDYNDQKRDYWNKKLDHLNDKRRKRYSEKAPEVLHYQKDWKHKNPYSHRLKRRLTQLREQQKLLALHYLKNDEYWLYSNSFQEVLPTFVLSDLLYSGKSLKAFILWFTCRLDREGSRFLSSQTDFMAGSKLGRRSNVLRASWSVRGNFVLIGHACVNHVRLGIEQH